MSKNGAKAFILFIPRLKNSGPEFNIIFLFLNVLGTLTKIKRLWVFNKAILCKHYESMQTFLDQLKIHQIHCFMQKAKLNLLPLQFTLPPKVINAKNEKKQSFLSILWQKFHFCQSNWRLNEAVKLSLGIKKICSIYFSIIFDLDKTINAKAFELIGEKNTECSIFIATNVFKIRIDNPDIKLIIQYDLPMSFDSIIHQISHARRQSGQRTVFISFTSK